MFAILSTDHLSLNQLRTDRILTTPSVWIEMYLNSTSSFAGTRAAWSNAARAILRDDDEAEDVVQDAYVRAYVSLHQFAGKAQFSTWLAKIAVHEASSRLRQRKRLQEVSVNPDQEHQSMEALKSSDADPEQQTLRHEAVSLLEAAVDALPEMYRSVFVLRDVENMNTGETADCLDLTEEAVKVRLLRARHMLRKELYMRAGATSSKAFQLMGARCDRVVHRVFDRLSKL
jgi:RNA polymerase sigma-70 factor (ECF subfamily)